MVRLELTDTALTVQLNWWEKAAARRSHLTVPRRSILSARPLDNAAAAVERYAGSKLSGTAIAGVTRSGTLTGPVAPGSSGTTSTFTVCHGTEPGLEILLDHPTVQRIVVATPDAGKILDRLDVGRTPVPDLYGTPSP
ncbi:hypothetical protein [Corynebacterium pygosceleis]|uniref:Uncharacterized protein n=1 Tax=Corynebacterium pygosceleis TaxID=2800406 RepID=A0A9Q4C7Y5_9CORY|nr:hypothetical protein [Corynebacterium pygosceleis]MCK7637436.1 hypothetical protein [Corynebacterium pygosceleis]MCL0119788.1 hypothetical protein [Corynebacterium pygosceleis]MCX7445036.1 hypothetical protein [Corynebacterium pygosceleis]MCX7468235.1 hypothetical protein [Corynebacterium pygosceleis]